MKKYEEIIDQLGAFGYYQIRAFILINLIEMPVCWVMFSPILINISPAWYCPVPVVNSSLNVDSGPVVNGGVNSYVGPVTNGGGTNWTDGTLSINNTAFEGHDNNTVGKGNVTLLKNSCPGEVICPGIQFDRTIKSIVTEWLLICSKDYIGDTITSVQMAGQLLGAMATGQLADLYGRKKVLYVEFTLMMALCFTSAFSTSWIMYAVLRFFIGGLSGGVLVVAFVLPLELVSPRWRTFCGCIGFWSLGQMTLALIGYFIRDWRQLIMITAGLCVLVLPSWWFVPESPRWLISRGRLDEAETLLNDMAAYNKKNIPSLKAMINKVWVDEKVAGQENKRYSFWHLCSNRQMTKTVFILMYCWFVASLIYYGISLNAGNLAGSVYVNICVSGAVELPALVFVVCVQNKLGRRLTVSLLIGMCGIFTLAFMILDLTGYLAKLSVLSLVFAMIGKAGITGGWDALAVYSAELYPTVIRNLGYSTGSLCARIGGIVAPQLVLLASDSGLTIPFAIFGVTSLMFVVLLWFLPETSGQPLPDTLSKNRARSPNNVENDPNDAAEDKVHFLPNSRVIADNQNID